jgi:class 3 adenylate cyclase
VSTCVSCGAENPVHAKFCLECGAPLAETQPAETRKTVTVLFCDITGSTAMGEKLDPESLRRVMSGYFDAMETVLKRHGAAVEKFIGDAIMAVFGIPTLHEDDALRAVRAAADMRDALATLNNALDAEYGIRIATRTGVNTGEVVAGDPSTGNTYVTGDAVNVGARLEQMARAGDILLGPTTVRLVRGAVTTETLPAVTVRGKAESIIPHRLLAVAQRGQPLVRGRSSPLVGRERETRQLRDALERSRSGPSCQLMTILGAAGVGKSRLVREFLRSAREEATVLRGRCLPYGDGITYWPVTETIRAAARIGAKADAAGARERLTETLAAQDRGEAIVDGLLGALGMNGETPARAEEIAWSTRRL